MLLNEEEYLSVYSKQLARILKRSKINLYIEERDCYEEKISIGCYGFISYSYQ